jgi:hypothetical protein
MSALHNVGVPIETEKGSDSAKVDPNIQIKFTIIFGILAFIPFVLFYFYGLDVKKESGVAGATNRVPKVIFAEISEGAGVRFVHVNGAAGEKLLPETMGGGCAFFDLEGDGDQDIVFVNSMPWDGSTPSTNGAARTEDGSAAASRHRLFANDGTGKFTDVTAGSGLDFASYGMGVATGDFDNDGRTDLFFTGVNAPGLPPANRLLRKRTGSCETWVAESSRM